MNKRFTKNIIISCVACILGACSFVSLNPDAENVSVLPSSTKTTNNCKFLGDVTVSLWSKSETFQSQKKVESQLDILARNEASKMSGNTVTPDSPITNAQRTYRVYNCKTIESSTVEVKKI